MMHQTIQKFHLAAQTCHCQIAYEGKFRHQMLSKTNGQICKYSNKIWTWEKISFMILEKILSQANIVTSTITQRQNYGKWHSSSCETRTKWILLSSFLLCIYDFHSINQHEYSSWNVPSPSQTLLATPDTLHPSPTSSPQIWVLFHHRCHTPHAAKLYPVCAGFMLPSQLPSCHYNL